MPELTVIIINYNSGGRLPHILEALSQQTYQDFDVLIYDNASEDGSEQVVAPEGVTTRIISSPENLGFAGGVMAAIKETDSEWVAVLNPDAYPEASWLTALTQAAKTYGENTILGSVQLRADIPQILDGLGDVYHISGTAWRGGFGKSTLLHHPDEDMEIFAPCFAAALFHRETFLTHGGLDEDFFCYHEDVDFGFRHQLYGGRAVLVYKARVHHEGSAITGRYSDFTIFHGIRNRQWTLIKNMPSLLLFIAAPLYLGFSVLFFFWAIFRGRGRPYAKGWMDGAKQLLTVWKKRKSIQANRKASLWTIARSLSWSPFAVLYRKSNMRPVNVEGFPLKDLQPSSDHRETQL